MPTENFITHMDLYIENANIYDIYDCLELLEWYNIILLALAWIFICSFIDYLLTPKINLQDKRLNGRYRYNCTGTTSNKKRCKRQTYNMPTCYQHVGINRNNQEE